MYPELVPAHVEEWQRRDTQPDVPPVVSHSTAAEAKAAGLTVVDLGFRQITDRADFPLERKLATAIEYVAEELARVPGSHLTNRASGVRTQAGSVATHAITVAHRIWHCRTRALASSSLTKLHIDLPASILNDCPGSLQFSACAAEARRSGSREAGYSIIA